MTAFLVLPYPLKYAIIFVSETKSKETVPRHKMRHNPDELLEE